MDGWISVKDKEKLPKEGENVILVNETGYVFFGYFLECYDGKNWYQIGLNMDMDMTHTNIKFWQPKPLPPLKMSLRSRLKE